MAHDEKRNDIGYASHSRMANSVSSPPYDIKFSSNSSSVSKTWRFTDVLLNKK